MSLLLNLPPSHFSSLNHYNYSAQPSKSKENSHKEIQKVYQKTLHPEEKEKKGSVIKSFAVPDRTDILDAEMFLNCSYQIAIEDAIDFANRGEFRRARETIVRVLQDSSDHVEALKLQQLISYGLLIQKLIESALAEKKFSLVANMATDFVKNFGFNHYMQQWIEEANLLESIRKAYELKDYSKLKQLANEYLITYGNEKYVILLEADLAMQVSLDPLRNMHIF